jgi:hypothetical protein
MITLFSVLRSIVRYGGKEIKKMEKTLKDAVGYLETVDEKKDWNAATTSCGISSGR